VWVGGWRLHGSAAEDKGVWTHLILELFEYTLQPRAWIKILWFAFAGCVEGCGNFESSGLGRRERDDGKGRKRERKGGRGQNARKKARNEERDEKHGRRGREEEGRKGGTEEGRNGGREEDRKPARDPLHLFAVIWQAYAGVGAGKSKYSKCDGAQRCDESTLYETTRARLILPAAGWWIRPNENFFPAPHSSA
jgi:hypothetical protein